MSGSEEITVVEFTPPKAKVTHRGDIRSNEVVVRLAEDDMANLSQPFSYDNIMRAFKVWRGTIYDIGELADIELEDEGQPWKWLGERLNLGGGNKVCSTGLAWILLQDFGVWPFKDIPEDRFVPPGSFCAWMDLVEPGDEQEGDYILTENKAKWYEFWMKFAYGRIKAYNRKLHPYYPLAWPWTHVQQIARIA